MCVLQCMCVCVPAYRYAYGGQKSALRVFFDCHSNSRFETDSLRESGSCRLSQTVWPVSSGVMLVSFPCVRIPDLHHCAQLLGAYWRVWAQILILLFEPSPPPLSVTLNNLSIVWTTQTLLAWKMNYCSSRFCEFLDILCMPASFLLL